MSLIQIALLNLFLFEVWGIQRSWSSKDLSWFSVFKFTDWKVVFPLIWFIKVFTDKSLITREKLLNINRNIPITGAMLFIIHHNNVTKNRNWIKVRVLHILTALSSWWFLLRASFLLSPHLFSLRMHSLASITAVNIPTDLEAREFTAFKSPDSKVNYPTDSPRSGWGLKMTS